MEDPIDSAVTITSHDTVLELIGSSIYFENGQYLTYKNLGAYEVEWGSLVYLSHKGSALKMGHTVKEAANLMKLQMSAAYFDPIDKRSKFVVSDGSLLGLTFELGAEYDKPLVSNLTSELKKYGVNKFAASIDAALTLTINNGDKLYLFEGKSFCSIQLSLTEKDQRCDMKSIKDAFLNCNAIDIKRGFCDQSSVKKSEVENPTSIEFVNNKVSQSSEEVISIRHVSHNNKPGNSAYFLIASSN